MDIKKENTNPLVSFCVFTYNQERFVADAIKGALKQDYSPLEIIISDDCSSDNTFKIIKELAKNYKGSSTIILNRNDKNLGLTAHVNKVLGMAKGEYILVAAGDDISLPNRTAKFVDAFQKDEDIVSISCNLTSIDSNGKKAKNNNSINKDIIYDINDYLNKENFHINGASRAIKREVFEMFGNLNPKCPTEDTPYLLRAFMAGKVYLLAEELVLYRTHDNNLSGENNIYKMSINEIYKQYKKDINKALTLRIINTEIADKLLLKLKNINYKRTKKKIKYKRNKLKQRINKIIKPPQKVNLYWYKGDNYTNFGDELSPYIISKLFNVKIINSNDYVLNLHDFLSANIYRILNLFIKLTNKIFSKNKEISIYHKKTFLSLGSIIGRSNNNTDVWGSGIIKKNEVIKGGRFHSVRGHKTIERLKELGLKPPKVVGDPALLLPLIYNSKIEKKYKLGIIPHYVDYDLIKNNINDPSILIVNLRNSNVETVINQILSCENIISSSLHGIIVSQAYKIPALWYKFSDNLAGDDIKFEDYFSSVSIKNYSPFIINLLKITANDIVEIINKNKQKASINTNLQTLQKQMIKVAPFK